MISKNLFFNLQKEDLKRRIWTIAIAMLVFFLCLPIICALRIESYSSYSSNEQVMKDLLRYMGPHNIVVIIITIMGAIICGLSGFFYLHSKKKVDLYHSIPVRREVLFAVSYIDGLLIYLIPYIINVILCLIVISIKQYMDVQILTTALTAIALNFLFYCFIHIIVVIAVMLTGNIIISCLGTAVFLLYGSFIKVIKEMYFSDFYNTYYMSNITPSKLKYFSPIEVYIDTINKINTADSGSALRIVAIVIAIILLLSFGLFLYKKRPSEAAGKAISFEISRPIIKFLLVIPISLGGGIIFREITGRDSSGWFIFGLLFTLVIIYAIIEIIYNFDIRKAFTYKKQMMGCTIIVALIACVFQFDIFHYDSYIPSKNKVESMSIAFSGLDSNISYFDMESEELSYMDSNSYQLEYMNLKDIDTAYELAQKGVQSLGNYIDVKAMSYVIKFTLKNGKEVYRSYKSNLIDSYDMIKNLYADTNFKEIHYPIYHWKAEDIGTITCRNLYDYKELGLNTDEEKQLIDTYKSELNMLTLDELTTEYPIATLSIPLNNYRYQEYYIYPTFTKTIEFLKLHGFDANREVKAADIEKVIIDNMGVKESTMYEYQMKEIATASREQSSSISYTDETKIEQILPNLILSDYYYNNQNLIEVEDNLMVTVMLRKDEYGNEESYSYYFKKDSIPDFVQIDVGYSK